MVSAVVTQAFTYLGRNVYPGDPIEMEPLDAAVKAHAGLVSLNHGQQYQTRHMEAARPEDDPWRGLSVEVSNCQVFVASQPPPAEPIKRRRGRPRKKQD